MHVPVQRCMCEVHAESNSMCLVGITQRNLEVAKFPPTDVHHTEMNSDVEVLWARVHPLRRG